MSLRKLIFPLLVSVFLIWGCTEEGDCNEDRMCLPTLKNGSFPTSETRLEPGQSFIFAPEVISQSEVTFRWLLNGEEVSSERMFEYTAEKASRSLLRLEMANDNGRISLENRLIVPAQGYKGRMLVVNEGWFGHETGSITAIDPTDNSVEHWAFRTHNFGMTLGITSQSATLFEDRLYVCSKDNNSLTVIDPATLYLEKQSGNLMPAGLQAYEFIGLDDRYGIITCYTGFYRIDLQTFHLEKVPFNGPDKSTGSGIVFGNKLIINMAYNNLFAIEISDLTQPFGDGFAVAGTQIDAMTYAGTRFVAGDDGNLYTVETVYESKKYTSKLVRISPDLSVEKAEMRDDYSPAGFGAYAEARFCGDGKDNFYYVGAGKIYRASFETAAPEQPMTQYAKSGYRLYGAAMRVDPSSGDVLAIYIKSDYSSSIIVRFDGMTGDVLWESEPMDHYWFPATIIFN